MGGRASAGPSRTQDRLLPPLPKRIGRGCEFTVLVYLLTDVKSQLSKYTAVCRPRATLPPGPRQVSGERVAPRDCSRRAGSTKNHARPPGKLGWVPRTWLVRAAESRSVMAHHRKVCWQSVKPFSPFYARRRSIKMRLKALAYVSLSLISL